MSDGQDWGRVAVWSDGDGDAEVLPVFSPAWMAGTSLNWEWGGESVITSVF